MDLLFISPVAMNPSLKPNNELLFAFNYHDDIPFFPFNLREEFWHLLTAFLGRGDLLRSKRHREVK